MIFTRVVSSPLGALLISASETGLTGCWFEGQKHFPTVASLGWTEHSTSKHGTHPILDRAEVQLTDYFHGSLESFDVIIDDSVWGTPFQRLVWKSLQKIERGECKTYAEIAALVGRPKAARAIGSAVGRNPWGIILPCHRVIGSDGSLTGYAGGLKRKQDLLALEGVTLGTSPRGAETKKKRAVRAD